MIRASSRSIYILLLFFWGVGIRIFSQNSQLWSMIEAGGQYEYGTIFRTDGNGNNQTTVKNFFVFGGLSPKYQGLTQASDGTLYGLTTYGGYNGNGVLFQFDPITKAYTLKMTFKTSNNNGVYPYGSLLLASDGKFYATTYQGGASNMGVIFQYDPVTSTFTKKVDFTGAANGGNPYCTLIQATDGKLYGMTYGGGSSGKGVLFQYDPVTNSLTKKVDFAGASNGANPYSSLMQASDGKIYGATSAGGANNFGVLFQYDPAINSFTKLMDFSGTTTGANPMGHMIEASNGKLYGITQRGGANNQGAIFQYDISIGSLAKKIDFNSTNGTYPSSSLFEASDGKLYGMANGGGTSGYGTLFQYDPSNNVYSKKYDFTGTATGAGPNGPCMQATDGKIYAMTESGGANNSGVLFQYDIVNSVYTKQFEFYAAPEGRTPWGSLLLANNKKLYGLLERGGINDKGAIFEYDLATASYAKKFDFDNVAHGAYPLGSLIEASDGKFYGLTNAGGTNDNGVIFQYDASTNICTKKVDFLSSTTGRNPYGSLVEVGNGKLYGVNAYGGANNMGTLFQYDLATSTFTKLIDFAGTSNGSTPIGSLTLAGSGKLYGSTTSGGPNNYGVIFSYDPSTSAFVKVFDLTSATGSSQSPFIEATDGKLYNVALGGGTYGMGTIFSFDPVTNTYTKKVDMVLASGASAYGALFQASNGMMYGCTTGGGVNSYGVLYQYDPVANVYTKKLDFNWTNGGGAGYNSLIEIPLTLSTQTVDTILCTGEVVNVPYAILGGYNSGNVFTAQLSDASGSFASPLSIGNVSAVASGTISATIPPGTPAGSGYRIRVVSSGPVVTGSDNGNNITINISPTVTVVADPAVPVCAGDTVTLLASGASTYTYSSGSPVIQPLATVLYTVTGADTNGCMASDTVTVIVEPLPVITVNSGSICVGQSFTISPAGANSYTYSSGSNVVSPTSSSSYTVWGVDANGCVGEASDTVKVNPLPDACINANSPVCVGSNIDLNYCGTLVSTYAWTGPSFSSSSTSPVIPSATPANAGTYILAVTTAKGCTDTDSIKIEVALLPVVIASVSSQTICAGNADTLYAAGANTYTWSASAGSVNTFSVVVTPTLSVTYVLTGTDTNGCANADSIDVMVNNCTTSHPDVTKAAIKMWPNPNGGSFSIHFDLSEDAVMQIADLEGRTLYKHPVGAGSTILEMINMNLENGAYLCVIVSKDQVVARVKLLIAK